MQIPWGIAGEFYIGVECTHWEYINDGDRWFYRPITIEETRRAVDHVFSRRAEWGLPTEGYDVVLEGDTFGGHRSPTGTPAEWAAAGASWWVESWWDLPDAPESVAELRRRIAGGPHR